MKKTSSFFPVLSCFFSLLLLIFVQGCAPAAAPVKSKPTMTPTATHEPTLRDKVEAGDISPVQVEYIDLGENIDTYEGQVVTFACMINSNYSWSKETTASAEHYYSGTRITIKFPEGEANNLKNGQYVYVIGKVDEGEIVDAYIDNSRTSAEYSVKEIDKKYLAHEKEKYLNLVKDCKEITYNDASRHPGDYEGSLVYFTGKIYQIILEDFTFRDPWGNYHDYPEWHYLLNVGKNNLVYIVLEDKTESLDGRLLEGDKVTFYGYMSDLETYTTTSGTSKTVPKMESFYVELK